MKGGRSWLSGSGGRWVILLLGGVYVAFALERVRFGALTDESLLSGLVTFGIVGIPGLVLLYAGYQLPETDIDPDTYPRIVAWCGVGCVTILAFLGLLHVAPQNNYRVSFWTTTFSTAIGASGGLLVGIYDARTVTQSRELRRQRRELRQRNERLDSFAHLLAHELRNPLSIAQMYQPRAADGDRDAAETVEAALTRIEEMVDVMLVIVRGEDAGIDRSAVALADVAEDAWADLDLSDAEFVVETGRTLLVDPIHLRHLLENLFENAVEHADTSVTVRVGDLASGFYVEDDGPGIPESERDRVFEAGYTTGGTGFGLMFVAELAEAYGWSYAITDGANGGTRVEFTDVDLVLTEKEQTV